MKRGTYRPKRCEYVNEDNSPKALYYENTKQYKVYIYGRNSERKNYFVFFKEVFPRLLNVPRKSVVIALMRIFTNPSACSECDTSFMF